MLAASGASLSASHGSLIDEVVRDGARRMLAAALEAEVAAYIDAHAGERQRFSSAILPAWCRKSPKVTEVLPLLYLHGLSSKDFGPALEGGLRCRATTRIDRHAFGITTGRGLIGRYLDVELDILSTVDS
jgi:hypothetical protein